MIGLGGHSPNLAVYIANRPPLSAYQNLIKYRSVSAGEIAAIAAETGNHWRKIFNCFAKLVFALNPGLQTSWQAYREQTLLQAHSTEQLLWSAPDLKQRNCVHIICGKTYFQQLNLELKFELNICWIDQDFAVAEQCPLIVSPYFDYRQLSNVKLARLVEMVKSQQRLANSIGANMVQS